MEQNQVEILLIEDNPHEAELAIRCFKKAGLANNLVHIDNGAEALDFLFVRGKYIDKSYIHLPKLILLDLKLPKIDGLEILRQIKSNTEMKAIPIVVLTSSKVESDIIESYKLGVNSYIVKPSNFESFSKSIADIGRYWLILNQHPVLSKK